MLETLNEQNLESICKELARKDRHLAYVFETYGAPPLWDREPTFATLIHIILEQQVSLASALSAFNKLKEKTGGITPEKVLELSDVEMKACYFSRQKMGYARDLANAIHENRIDLEALNGLSDKDVTIKLKTIKGIGDWTAQVYLLMVMLRVDVMPRGDIALHAACQKLMNLDKRPSSDEFVENAKKWAPYRSVAARLLWHFYLSTRNKDFT